MRSSKALPLQMPELAVWVVDRRRKKGLKSLRMMLGRAGLDRALALPGRWIFGTCGRGGKAVWAFSTEAELMQAHRELLQLPCSGPVEIFTYVEPALYGRLKSEMQTQALRLAPAAGNA